MADTNTATGLAAASTQSVVIVTITSQQDTTGQTETAVIVTAFSTVQYTPSATRASTTAQASASNTIATAANTKVSGGGLNTGGTIAVAVAVPIVVLSILAFLGIFFWKRRKRNRTALAQRREEQDQYSFHPNETSFVAAPVATHYGGQDTAQQPIGQSNTYRGWQPTNVMRQTSGAGGSGFQLGRGTAVPDNAQSSGVISAESGEPRLETPTLPAMDYVDDFDTTNVMSPSGLAAPGNGSPPLGVLSSGSPSSEYSQHIPTRFPHGEPPYPVRSIGTMPSLQPGHSRPVSGAIRDRSYFDE